jgi:Putative Flp pilus-assembly TadE/G-like
MTLHGGDARWGCRPDLFRPSPKRTTSKRLPAWPRQSVSQRGQAIVLIAIMLAVVVGMAALAIDGARAYAVRRDLQAAVDAAALAAGDRLQQTGSYVSAEQAASTIFGTDLRLYAAPSCSPGYGSPGASPLTLTCTYPDGTVLTQVISALGPRGTRFAMTAKRPLVLQFARILTSGTTPQLSATATGGVNNLLYAPTVAALSHAGCGGLPGAAISVTSGGTMNVVGDVVSSGAISSLGTLQVAGDVYARCQTSVPNVVAMCYPSGNPTPCTYPDVAGATRSGYNFVDPNYPPPPVVGGSQPTPGSNVILLPGVYASNPAFASGRCYFLAGGAYKWLAGYTNNGGFVSNELRPPDEPRYDDNTRTASHQFWNVDGANCQGSAMVTSVAGFRGVPNGAWALVLTSTRTAIFGGVSYVRESAPSVCYTTFVNGSGRNILVQVSNVPGATAYNIYAAPNGSCNGPFGLAAVLPVPATPAPENDDLGDCPSFTTGPGACSLGTESITLDANDLGASFSPNPLAPPGIFGSSPPDGETAPLRSNLPNENANRDVPPSGDRANENQCDTLGGALTTCPGAVTPGAVSFYIPSGGCLSDSSSGDNYFFSGYQYNWMVLYEPGAANPPANTCSNTLGAATDSAFVGLVYTPSAAISVQKASAFRTDEGGGVIANTLTFGGQLPTIIGDSADYGPVPPASRLTG